MKTRRRGMMNSMAAPELCTVRIGAWFVIGLANSSRVKLWLKNTREFIGSAPAPEVVPVLGHSKCDTSTCSALIDKRCVTVPHIRSTAAVATNFRRAWARMQADDAIAHAVIFEDDAYVTGRMLWRNLTHMRIPCDADVVDLQGGGRGTGYSRAWAVTNTWAALWSRAGAAKMLGLTQQLCVNALDVVYAAGQAGFSWEAPSIRASAWWAEHRKTLTRHGAWNGADPAAKQLSLVAYVQDRPFVRHKPFDIAIQCMQGRCQGGKYSSSATGHDAELGRRRRRRRR